MRESGAEMIRLGSFKPQAQLDSPSVETLSAVEGEGSEPLYLSPPSTPSTSGRIAHINSWTSEGQLPSMSEGQLSEGSEGWGGGWSRVGVPRSSQSSDDVSSARLIISPDRSSSSVISEASFSHEAATPGALTTPAANTRLLTFISAPSLAPIHIVTSSPSTLHLFPFISSYSSPLVHLHTFSSKPLHIVAGSEAALRKAEVLCRRHLEHVRNDYNRWLEVASSRLSSNPNPYPNHLP
ncbi:MAG: hypothetical protein SGPRY_000549 [Prymnesium sp.]